MRSRRVVDGERELHALERPALVGSGSRLDARAFFLLGALAQLLSSRVALEAGGLQFFDGAVWS